MYNMTTASTMVQKRAKFETFRASAIFALIWILDILMLNKNVSDSVHTGM